MVINIVQCFCLINYILGSLLGNNFRCRGSNCCSLEGPGLSSADDPPLGVIPGRYSSSDPTSIPDSLVSSSLFFCFSFCGLWASSTIAGAAVQIIVLRNDQVCHQMMTRRSVLYPVGIRRLTHAYSSNSDDIM